MDQQVLGKTESGQSIWYDKGPYNQAMLLEKTLESAGETPGDYGQWTLACYSPWGHKESDTI